MDVCPAVTENIGNTNGLRIGSWLPLVGILGGFAGFVIDTLLVLAMSVTMSYYPFLGLMLLADVGCGYAAGRMLRSAVNGVKSKGDIFLSTLLYGAGAGYTVALVNIPFLFITTNIDDVGVIPIAVAIGAILGIIVALPLSGILILCARRKFAVQAAHVKTAIV